MIVAVIGIGSNSVRMLTADVREVPFRRLARDRAGTRLFAGLDEQGNLSPESMAKTLEAVGQMALEARRRQADRLHLFATSAARDARNGREFMEAAERAAGVPLEILSGQEEAELSFRGASAVAPEGVRCGVIDIGGGSTEIVSGLRRKAGGASVDCAFSCQMGAVRLYRQLPLECRADMATVEAEATRILEENLAAHPECRAPDLWAGTGGTFTTLAAMAKNIPWQSRECMHGTRITEPEIRRLGEVLADLDPESRKRLPGLQPGRADIVVHGICILLAVMKRLDIPGVIVSEYGNLDGYISKMYEEQTAAENR